MSLTNTPLAKIVTSDGRFSYQLTDQDLIVMARSIRKESKADQAEIAWCYAQRYAMLKVGGLSAYPTLASMITAFSQPINPAWFPDGRFCAPGSQYHDSPRYCGAHATNRLSNATIAWDRIEPSVRAYVLSWADCREENPCPGAVDFRARDEEAATIIAGRSTRDLIYMPMGTAQAFFATARSSRWPRNYVQLVVGDRAIGEREPMWWQYGLVVLLTVGVFAGTAGYLGRGPGRP